MHSLPSIGENTKILLNVVQNHPLHNETCNYSVNLLSISNDDRKM